MDQDTFTPLPLVSVSPVMSGAGGLVSKVKDKVSSYFGEYGKYVNAKPNPAAQTKQQPKINNLGSYKSLADLQASGYGKDKKVAEFAAARQLKDVSKAPTPALKAQAVAGKWQRVQESEMYSKLRPENQAKVKASFFHQFVSPTLKENGIEPPSVEEWVAGYGSEKTYLDSGGRLAATYGNASVSGFMKGLAGTFEMLHRVTMPFDEKAPEQRELAKLSEKFHEISKTLIETHDGYEAAFENRHGVGQWLANFGGQILGEAPAYIAADEIAGGIKIAEAIPTMAEKGVISKGYKVAVHNLQQAGSQFLVSKGEGHTNFEASKDAAVALVAGTGISGISAGLGKLVGKAGNGFIDLLRWGGAKLGAGGEPFANKIAEQVDRKEVQALEMHPADYEQVKEFSRYIEEHKQSTKALVNDKDPDVAKAVEAEKAAIQEHGRGKVAAATKIAAETMPLFNHELQTVANAKELADAAKLNPEFATALQQMEQITGLSAAKELTSAQASRVATDMGLDNPVHALDDMFGQSGRNIKRAKTIPIVDLTKAGEDEFVKGTRNYLPDSRGSKSVGGKVSFEGNNKNHLLYLTQSDAPQAIRAKATSLLRKEYLMTPGQIKTKAGFLVNTHMADLEETGILQKEGNVYHSTKPAQARWRTQWQAALQEDLNEHDLGQLKKLFKNSPELRQPITGLIEALADKRYKSATPLTSVERRTKIRQIRDLLKEVR